MITLDYCEFYITNVCNLACPDCNRFNNFAFKGHQYWNDHAEEYQQWSRIVDAKSITIIGGEPLLNPDFLKWVHGIAGLWPKTSIRIVTNGTQFRRWPTLIEEISQYHGRVFIEINEHDAGKFEKTKALAQKLLGNGVVCNGKVYDIPKWNQGYIDIKDDQWPDLLPWEFENADQHIQQECINLHKFVPDSFLLENRSDAVTYSNNNVRIVCIQVCDFYEPPYLYNQDKQTLTLLDNNADQAAKVCKFIEFKCVQFVRGKLYKCPVVALLPEVVEQFLVNMTDHQRQLIDAYVPAEPSWPSEQLASFVQSLKNGDTIEQCRFCSLNESTTNFTTSRKKFKLHKI